MRHILSFKTTFPESSDFKHPQGYSVCKYLEDELSNAGFIVQALDNYRDIAWRVDCEINEKKVYFFVGYLGIKMSDWQLIICSGIGFIRRLFGHNDENERIKLASAIHTILSSDDRFTDLKWFSKYTDSPKDVWYPEPA